MTVVLDASALLAYLRQEPGGEMVDGLLAESVMTSVNWAEVVQKSISAGVEVEGMLWAPMRQLGLSLGDRAWAELPLNVVIQLLR